MPLVSRTNNKVGAPNSRAVDVARAAVDEITPVQQRKTHNAFMVQGFPGILYMRKSSGVKCTCQSGAKIINSVLQEDGTADSGTINRMLTGGTFGVEDYGATTWDGVISTKYDNVRDKDKNYEDREKGADKSSWTSPLDNSVFEGVPDIDSSIDDPFPVGDATLEDMVEQFDPAIGGFGDYACPVCFGTGLVGGYSIGFGQRMVFGVHQMGLGVGDVSTSARPWRATTEIAQVVVTLPRGATSVTSATLFNGHNRVGYSMTVNSVPVKDEQHLLSLCQGLPVLMELRFAQQEITHFELQFSTSVESVYYEFPKIQKSSDLQFLELTEPFQILMSPNVPMVRVEDVLTDGVYGKAMIVQSVSPWQTKLGNSLGWEVQVRVAQPYESPNLLPRLTRVETKARTTRMVRDNITGHRRT